MTLRTVGWLVAIMATATLAPKAGAAEFTVAPFLQRVTPDSVLVVWEQTTASAPEVRYGPTTGYGEVAGAAADRGSLLGSRAFPRLSGRCRHNCTGAASC